LPAMPADQATMTPPILTSQVELSAEIESINDHHPDGGRYGWAVLLVRLHGAPLGPLFVALPEGGLSGETVRGLAEAELAGAIAEHWVADGVSAAGQDTAVNVPADPVCLRSAATFLESAPPLSVVVATRDRPERVVACVSALLAMTYPHPEIIVVDNAPTSDATARLIAERFANRPEVRYLREDRPGVSRARNLGLRAARAEYVAFTDDDVLVDPAWAAALTRPMVEDDRVACVTGLVVAAEVETRAQLWFEEYGGFYNGYRRVVHELGGSEPESPLFPYAAGSLGCGASMAFRSRVLRGIGGFDPALGGGTPARAGEDSSAFVEVLLGGWRLTYEPAAVARHFHRRSYEELSRTMLGYSGGLSAYLTRTAVHHPRRIPAMVVQAFRGARIMLDPRSSKNTKKRAGYPAELVRLELLGMACGPFWYARSVVAARRLRRFRPGRLHRIWDGPDGPRPGA
jgi:glycosyltransferase involved in cell wall biosynthesis